MDVTIAEFQSLGVELRSQDCWNIIVNAGASSSATSFNSWGDSSSGPCALLWFNCLSWDKTPHASMESEGIDSNGDTPSKRVIFLLGMLKTLWKWLLRDSALPMSELHTLVPVFNVGTPILSVLFSLTYVQKHFGFSTRLLPMILLI